MLDLLATTDLRSLRAMRVLGSLRDLLERADFVKPQGAQVRKHHALGGGRGRALLQGAQEFADLLQGRIPPEVDRQVLEGGERPEDVRVCSLLDRPLDGQRRQRGTLKVRAKLGEHRVGVGAVPPRPAGITVDVDDELAAGPAPGAGGLAAEARGAVPGRVHRGAQDGVVVRVVGEHFADAARLATVRAAAEGDRAALGEADVREDVEEDVRVVHATCEVEGAEVRERGRRDRAIQPGIVRVEDVRLGGVDVDGEVLERLAGGEDGEKAGEGDVEGVVHCVVIQRPAVTGQDPQVRQEGGGPREEYAVHVEGAEGGDAVGADVEEFASVGCGQTVPAGHPVQRQCLPGIPRSTGCVLYAGTARHTPEACARERGSAHPGPPSRS